jgi:hypothetical protein
MKALVFENLVQCVREEEYPVHSSMVWMDAPENCEDGWIEKDGVISAPVEPVLPYNMNRYLEYPPMGDQLDMIYKDMLNSTTTHKDAVEAVKTKWPKNNKGPIE